jgi:hypothetical protein
VLDYHVNEDHLAEKQPAFTQQGLICGVTLAKIGWEYSEVEMPKREFHPDATGGMLEVEQNERLILRDGPTFETWDVYDAWWDPSVRDDIQKAAYIVLRSWLSKDDLLKQAQTDDNPHGQFQNVQQALAVGPGGRRNDSAQEDHIGNKDKRKDLYEVWEVWRNTPYGVTQTIICEQNVLLRHRTSPFWHGQLPVVMAQPRIDMFESVGVSLAELVDHLQEALWTLQNMRFDNLHLTVHRGFTYREAGIIDPSILRDGLYPRFAWPVTDHDDIRPIDIQGLPREAYEEDAKLMGILQLVTGINPYVSGSETSGIDQNTATGVTALQDVASRLLRFMARQLAFKGYQRAGEMWVELVKQFMTDTMAVRIEGQDENGEPAYDWQEISPQEVVGSFDVAVEGTEESLSKQQERGESMALLQAMAPFAQLPGINLRPVLEKVARPRPATADERWPDRGWAAGAATAGHPVQRDPPTHNEVIRFAQEIGPLGPARRDRRPPPQQRVALGPVHRPDRPPVGRRGSA